jgi:hypothetical protein
MNANSTRNLVVETGGDQVVGHVGLHALGSFADRLGLGEVLSGAVGYEGRGIPTHDRGRVLVQTMLMLAGGGESCADIEALGSQQRLFGEVCSDSTLYRTFTKTLTGEALARGREAVAGIRSEVWARKPDLAGDGPVVLDIDGSLVEIHSDNKEGAAPTYKKGYGFHPLVCFADATGEALAAELRPGNAAPNDTSDLLAVIDGAISQLPSQVAAGHRPGDEPESVAVEVVVRSDSAGENTYAKGLRERNLGFQTVARRKLAVSAAISVANEDPGRWQPAVNQDGSPVESDDDGGRISEVCEVTDLVDLSMWPKGTRLVIRREPLHPGAQQTLFPDNDYRFWGHYTDQDGDPAELDRQMRAHAHVEDHIQRLKDSGLLRFPFTDFAANQAWLQVVCWASDLVVWFQHLCLTGPLAVAKPKRLRWTLWHTPARIIRTARRDVIRILDGWPTTTDLLAAYTAIVGFA